MAGTVIFKDQKLFSSTSVDNRFIAGYMADAPEGAVKVYLYSLMLLSCGGGNGEDIASALSMTEEQVNDALMYWEKQGLVRASYGENGSLAVQFLPFSEISSGSELNSGAQNYHELVSKLQEVLGTRNLSGTDLKKIYDWIEVFGFDEDASVEIVRHCIEIKGARVHINYMDSVAKRLAADGILTLDSVRENFKRQTELSGGAAAILKRWNLSRRPTEDEVALYDKWVREWGFTEEAISLALSDMVAVDRPNFKYLDAILSSYHEKGSVSADDMREVIREQDMIAELARQAFTRAGLKRNASANDRRQFEFWVREYAMSAELILYAAELSAKKGTPFAEMKRLITTWHEKGIASFQAAKEFQQTAEAEQRSGSAKGRSVNRALNYKQRKYTKEELKKLGIDFGEDDDDED